MLSISSCSTTAVFRAAPSLSGKGFWSNALALSVEDSLATVVCFCHLCGCSYTRCWCQLMLLFGGGATAVEVVVVRSSGQLQLLIHCFCNPCCNSSTTFAVFELLIKPSPIVLWKQRNREARLVFIAKSGNFKRKLTRRKSGIHTTHYLLLSIPVPCLGGKRDLYTNLHQPEKGSESRPFWKPAGITSWMRGGASTCTCLRSSHLDRPALKHMRLLQQNLCSESRIISVLTTHPTYLTQLY